MKNRFRKEINNKLRKQSFKILLLSVILTLSLASIGQIKSIIEASAAATVPTSQNQTLMSSVAPENATRGQALSWLIWTDPPLPDQLVTEKIVDQTNGTTIYSNTEALRTLNNCGDLVKTVSTTGFATHVYKFSSNITVGTTTITSTRYIDFTTTPVTLSIYADVTPDPTLTGDAHNVTIYNFNFPYVSATATMKIYNNTNPSIWTMSDVNLPASNGSRRILIPPIAGMSAGTYYLRVNATSAIGNGTTTTSFELKDIILTVDSGYYIGQPTNITIRTSPTVTQSGVNITYVDYSYYPYTVGKVADLNLALSDGKVSYSFNTATWPEESYTVKANASIGSKKVFDNGYFSLVAFSVSVSAPNNKYIVGTPVNLTISTTPIQAGAAYNGTVTNSTGDTMFTIDPSTLNSNGWASLLISTTGWPIGNYYIDVFVNNTHYTETGYDSFNLFLRTFNIYATLPGGSFDTYIGYAMPILNIATMPGQTIANMTLYISCSYGHTYDLFKPGFDLSSYQYLLPLPEMRNGSYTVNVNIKSYAGTNSTSTYLFYNHLKDKAGDGITDAQKIASGLNPNSPYADDTNSFFAGYAWFHGLITIIPEFPQPFPMLVLILALSSLFLLLNRKMKTTTQRA
ncbi:MAG: hypothetical protein QG670_2517 [Thermoproteota archaeon]|nr:hypothetical protein [Thermoproteota archaeon]